MSLIWALCLANEPVLSKETKIPVVTFQGAEISQPKHSFLIFSSDTELTPDFGLVDQVINNGLLSGGLMNFGITNKHHYLLFKLQNKSDLGGLCLDLGVPAIDVVEL